MATAFLDALKARRSIYPLTKELPASLTKSRVESIITEAIAATPSSFNSQSNRAVLLLGAEHDKLWDITAETLKAIVPAENWEPTASKMAMFKAAAGSVLVFEDQDVVKGMQDQFPLYADRFGPWATQSAGMLQLNLWTALELEGAGANLQHYNPLIDEKVASTWKIPASWKLNAQLVFGGKGGEAGPKESKPAEEVFKSFSS
ncbi:related to oxidoreductase related to nitroreductase [Cephalotrichum gorgonifer]|uniref:Related to oxidoreductase related to nitroreductase n=1 Tax=Cephalotrichum gorgonifer TaxID=2041049 RepID=A0AAE8SS20_9PEZI|nr:related to oxidoreductase related to nitroreductase [Cephalotrichum gorgonifer]